MRDIGDARGIVESTPEAAPVRMPWAPWTVAVALLVAFGAVSFVHYRETPPEARVTTTSIVNLRRDEPDASLFTVPQEFQVIDEASRFTINWDTRLSR